MTRALLALCLLFPIGCAASGRMTAELAATPAPGRASCSGPEEAAPVAAEVERYLAHARLEQIPLTRPEPLLAPASGGVVGLLVPQVNVWFPEIEGEMSDENDEIDFNDDVGLGDGDVAVFPMLQIGLGSGGIRLSGFLARFDGDNTLQRTFTFGGIDFTVNERVQSQVEILNGKAMFQHAIVDTENLSLALQGGVSVLYVEAEVVGETLGRAEDEALLPVPLAGIVLQAKLSRFLFEIDVSGLTISYGDLEATVIDAQASVGITLFEVVAVRGGYRYLFLDGRADEFELDATLQGLFVGASVQF